MHREDRDNPIHGTLFFGEGHFDLAVKDLGDGSVAVSILLDGHHDVHPAVNAVRVNLPMTEWVALAGKLGDMVMRRVPEE